MCPVVIRLTLHETVRWLTDVFFLGKLQLRLLFLRRHARERGDDDGLNALATIISELKFFS